MRRMFCLLGLGLLNGFVLAFPLNPSFSREAVREYAEKARAGDAESQYLYAVALVSGQGVTKDVKSGFSFLEKAVAQGYSRAWLTLGRGYKKGWSGVPDPERAATCYKAYMDWAVHAAERGDANAQYGLGTCLEEESAQGGEAFKHHMAIAWYEKAAAQGHKWAQIRLGCYYDDGGAEEECRDAEKAFKWWKKAAEQGCVEAYHSLGSHYHRGSGVAEDQVEAVKWYRKAAIQGDKWAQYDLGHCYEKGEGIERNMVEAAKWYQKAAEQGYEDAQSRLGRCYEKGLGVEQDWKESVRWYRKAADQGDSDAQYALGRCYLAGNGVEKDAYEAVRWFRKGAAGYDSDAMNDLGECCLRGVGTRIDYREAVECFEKAASWGNARAQKNLGYCYENGIGVEKNAEEAIKWLRKASGVDRKDDAKADVNAVRIHAKLSLTEFCSQYEPKLGKAMRKNWSLTLLPEKNGVYYLGPDLKTKITQWIVQPKASADRETCTAEISKEGESAASVLVQVSDGDGESRSFYVEILNDKHEYVDGDSIATGFYRYIGVKTIENNRVRGFREVDVPECCEQFYRPETFVEH